MLILGTASPAVANAAGKKPAKKAQGSVKVQMRGVMLTPNWSGPGSPEPAGIGGGKQLAEIDKACELGSDVVRFSISWPLVETYGPGLVVNSYVSQIDAAFERARSCGIKVIAAILGTPCWLTVPAGQTPDCHGNKPSAQPGQMQRFTTYLLQRYPDLFALEVWNEPNANMFFSGTPADYVAMIHEADAARDGIGSPVKILAGSLAGTDVGYLEALYAAGLSGHDGISLHPYSFGSTGGTTAFYNPGKEAGKPKRLVSTYVRGVESIRRSMVGHGDATKGMWFTEFGFATCPATPACVSQERQANWLTKSFRIAAERWPYVHGLTAMVIRDISATDPAWDYHFGLLNYDFTPKPAFAAVKRTFKQLRKAELHPKVTKLKAKRKA